MIAEFPVRTVSLLHRSSRDGKNWLDFVYIFKVDHTEFGNKLDIGCEREKEVKNNVKVLPLIDVKETMGDLL